MECSLQSSEGLPLWRVANIEEGFLFTITTIISKVCLPCHIVMLALVKIFSGAASRPSIMKMTCETTSSFVASKASIDNRPIRILLLLAMPYANPCGLWYPKANVN